MTWGTIADSKYGHAIREIEKQTHRGVALIATAIVQDHLELAIRAKFKDDKQVQNKLLSIGGRLNDFGTQIELGYLLELYPKPLYERLLIARDIRNDFAHKMDAMSFSFHRERCRKLATDPTMHKNWTKVLKNIGGPDMPPSIFAMSKPSTRPKTQFIRFCQIATTLLSFHVLMYRLDPARQASSPGK